MLNQITMKAARVNRGLTQAEMAKRMGRSQNTVMAWERGDKMPKADEFQRYCSICGCDITDVLLPEVLEKN